MKRIYARIKTFKHLLKLAFDVNHTRFDGDVDTIDDIDKKKIIFIYQDLGNLSEINPNKLKEAIDSIPNEDNAELCYQWGNELYFDKNLKSKEDFISEIRKKRFGEYLNFWKIILTEPNLDINVVHLIRLLQDIHRHQLLKELKVVLNELDLSRFDNVQQLGAHLRKRVLHGKVYRDEEGNIHRTDVDHYR